MAGLTTADGEAMQRETSNGEEATQETPNDLDQLNLSTLATLTDIDEADEKEEKENGIPGVVEETVSGSSADMDRDDLDLSNPFMENGYQNGYLDGFCDYDNAMPLMHYSRMAGSIPRHPNVPVQEQQQQQTETNGETPAATETATLSPKAGTLVSKVTCSAIGKVLLDPASPENTASGGSSAAQGEAGRNADQLLLTSDLWKQPFHIMATGSHDDKNGGAISLISLPSGESVIPRDQLRIREGGHPSNDPAVVDVQFDASGTILSAIDAGGTCTVWELKYTPALRRVRQPSPDSSNSNTTAMTSAVSSNSQGNASTVENNMFSSFMSALTGMPTGAAAGASTNQAGNNVITRTIPCVTATIVQVSRINYPRSFGLPTSLAIDPAYKRKTNKAMMVGFLDGRLLLTKRGFFQRRNDSVIYQGQPKANDESAYKGIETIAWRGTLIAWADACGIKIFDSETLVRLAHIDRPTGARPSLYPTIASLKPTLKFETSSKVLVAWGDCLMSLTIKESKVTATNGSNSASSTSSSSQTPGSSSSLAKRRTVQCTMAWELDCVACDAAPLDNDHVVILGLVPPVDDSDDEDDVPDGNSDGEPQSGASRGQGNDVELQILSRETGLIMYSDAIPMLSDPGNKPGGVADDASSFSLLSSFMLQRMEDQTEVVLDRSENKTDIPIQDALLAPLMEGTRKKYKDAHTRWNLSSILFEHEAQPSMLQMGGPLSERGVSNGARNGDEAPSGKVDADGNDDGSVYSDMYSFVDRGLHLKLETMDSSQTGPPPIMAITSGEDIITIRMTDVDDAIAHALERKRPGVALFRALQHRRNIRTYSLNELVNRFFEALLRDRQDPTAGDSTAKDTRAASLSLKRVQLAVRSMPTLFGGHIDLWRKWTQHVETIPGGLFLLRDHIPVRDPILPKQVYDNMLKGMLHEIDTLNAAAGRSNDDEAEGLKKLAREGESQFLSSMVAWGPTKVLQDYIKLYKFARSVKEHSEVCELDLKQTEVSLQRRYMQTSALYLNFDATRTLSARSEDDEIAIDRISDASSNRSLCTEEFLLKIISPRTPMLSLPGEGDEPTTANNKVDDENENSALTVPRVPNSRLALDAMARIRMMQDRYDLALKSLLAIGAFHSTRSLQDLEKQAVSCIQDEEEKGPMAAPTVGSQAELISETSYVYVLGLIELHHLHRLLLNEEFILSTDSKLFMPIFALIRLVGLDLVGSFLIEHCVSPVGDKQDMIEQLDGPRRETLPIDQVAAQLQKSPALLHWYLHLVFTKKPEVYVKFPNTANPPRAVTELHRMHFDLYIDFAHDTKDSARSLKGTEAYNAEHKTTPLLRFLMAALPLGGIRPIEARRTFESLRAKKRANLNDEDDDDDSAVAATNLSAGRREVHDFALELAYVIEHFSNQTETEARGVVELYLKGVESIVLAVAYSQRQTKYTSMLWDDIISFCVQDDKLFGSMLEAAALFGADLARLVTRIPPGMSIEGLRRRLTAAVADYRLKVEIHKAATESTVTDRLSLLREITHRSRRGIRCDVSKIPMPPKIGLGGGTTSAGRAGTPLDASVGTTGTTSTRRWTKKRRDRYKLSIKPAMR